jgi:pyrimidine deaminase RibD-like protein
MKVPKRRDRRRMNAALRLARGAEGKTGENPSVGCVITDAEGVMIASGVTGKGGRPHAEEIALDAAGARAQGGTAYVTLEPCRSRSTGGVSCASRLVQSGIVRVVVAIEDPHPVARDGLKILLDAGVRVELGLGRRAAQRLYADFFARVKA